MAVLTKVSGKTGLAGAVLALVLALALGACGNALQDEVDSLKKELADKNAQIETLHTEKTTAENSVRELEAQLEALEGIEVSLREQLDEEGISGDTLREQIDALLANETEHTALIASIQAQLAAAGIPGDTLPDKIESLVQAKPIWPPI